MNWSGLWSGLWSGTWWGSSGDADGISAASAVELDAISGTATAAVAIVGASSATLGDAIASPIAVAPPRPFIPTAAGWLVGRRPRQAIAGRSAGTLADVSGAATGKVSALTPRQLRGRRDDADLLVSGWR